MEDEAAVENSSDDGRGRAGPAERQAIVGELLKRARRFDVRARAAFLDDACASDGGTFDAARALS